MSRKLLVPIVAVAILSVLGGAATYAYFFSGLRTSPATLGLTSPTPTVSASASPATTSSSYAGTWHVASGSVAGYRVKEQFVGQTSTHEAVARTSDVSGKVTITQSGSTYQLSTGTITVQLSSLASVDQVAGYNVTNRDRIVQNALDVSSYPTATFVASRVTIPDGAASGQAVTVSVPGQLTIHGVTSTVIATLQLRVSGTTAQVAGTIAITMSDYGVTPPSIGFTTVQPAATLEFQVNLTKSA
jgi:polyisoprenoid-binding protein YceI